MKEKLIYSVVSTFICCILIVIYTVFYRKGKKIHLEDLIIIGLLIVISSLRYGVGSDYFRYLEGASRWARLFDSNIRSLFTEDVLQKYSYEIGYKILSVFSYRISQSPYTIFWLVSIVMYIPLVVYCRKDTKDARIAIAVYLLFGYWGISLNVIGQSVAMIFMLYANQALDSKKYIRSIVFTLCSISFHTTAILAAVLILLTKIAYMEKFFKPTRKNLVKMFVIGVVARFSIEVLGNFLFRSTTFSKYTKYLSTEVSDKIVRSYMMIGAIIEGAIVLLILYMAIRKLEHELQTNPKLSKMISIVMLGVPFNIIGISRSDWLWLSNRFAEYFFIFLIALLPEVLESSKSISTHPGAISINQRRVPFWLTMIFWHAIFAVLMFNNNHFVIDTYLFK